MTSTFQETRWSLVQQAKAATPESRAALSDLCALYYSPVRAFVSAACSTGAESADDLTHSFFESILQGRSLAAADPARGRFRTFLLGAVKHFLYAHSSRLRTLKRGGRSHHEPLHDAPDLADPATLPPDALFDRHWACTVLDHTLERLRQEQEAAGKADSWLILKPWLGGDANHGDTAQAAAQLGISQTAVRVHLHRLRKRWRRHSV